MSGSNFTSDWMPRMLSVLRIVTGLLFLEHGSQKLFSISAACGAAAPDLMSLLGIQGCLEVVGGVLIASDFSPGRWPSFSPATWPWLISSPIFQGTSSPS